MIIGMFLIGFFLGLIYILIAEKLPLFIPEITEKLDNSWILNLFIASLNGLVFIISYGAFGLSYDFFVSLIIAALVIIIFLTDFKYLIILDSPLVVAGVLMMGLFWL